MNQPRDYSKPFPRRPSSAPLEIAGYVGAGMGSLRNLTIISSSQHTMPTPTLMVGGKAPELAQFGLLLFAILGKVKNVLS